MTTSQACVRLPTPRFLTQRVDRSGLGFSTLPPGLSRFPGCHAWVRGEGRHGSISRVGVVPTRTSNCRRVKRPPSLRLSCSQTPGFRENRWHSRHPNGRPVAPRRASALRAEAEKRRRAARGWLSAGRPSGRGSAGPALLRAGAASVPLRTGRRCTPARPLLRCGPAIQKRSGCAHAAPERQKPHPFPPLSRPPPPHPRHPPLRLTNPQAGVPVLPPPSCRLPSLPTQSWHWPAGGWSAPPRQRWLRSQTLFFTALRKG
jgi:hypothetical protein